jgi:glutathione S-transferase
MPAVKLFQLPGAWGAPSVSPFCIKLETYLRLAKVPFESRNGAPMQSPNGKVPWGDIDGTVVADSQRVIEHLATHHGVDLDQRLSESEKRRSHALRRILEASTYFGLCWIRWVDEEGFAAYKPVLLKMAPPVLNHLVLPLLRRGVKKQVMAQGTGLLSEQEVHALVLRDFEVLDEALGTKPFVLGDEPTSIDAVLFAFVESLMAFPVEGPSKAAVRDSTRLLEFRARVRALAYPESAQEAR